MRVNCVLETGFALTESGFRALFSVISAKDDVNPPSFKISSFVPEWKYQQGPLCLRVLLGVSLSLREQVLGGTYIIVHGDSSGFFCAQTLPRA